MTNNEVPKLQYCKIKFYKHDIFNTYKIKQFLPKSQQGRQWINTWVNLIVNFMMCPNCH